MSRDLLFLTQLMFIHLLLADGVPSGKMQVDSAKACALMHCDSDDHCVNRKFWCKNPPCPSMLYCSKTTEESLKGPATCASVRCTKGYKCLVKVHTCRWDQKCKQQIARCVSAREYQDSPASCVDFHCPSSHRCILRESLCNYPPCKLLKICAKTEDVQIWHDECRSLGCLSDHECFLRRPLDNCISTNSCKHTPDCTNVNVPVDPDCRGWICPRHQECSALVPKSCGLNDGFENCEVNRTCHEPIATSDKTSSPSARLIPRTSTVATNIENSDYQTNYSEPSLISNESYHRQSNNDLSHPTAVTTPSDIRSKPNLIETKQDESNCCNPTKSAVHGNSGMHLETWRSQSGSIYRTPIYVRPTMNRSNDEPGESLDDGRPIVHSITQWLDHLRLKTGVDAIHSWIKEAQENRNYDQFCEWLETVKTNLGTLRFGIWLREIRKLTSGYPAFQKWLPTNEEVPPLTEHETDSGNDMQQETVTVIPDQKRRLEVNGQVVSESTENPFHDYDTLMDVYPRPESGNNRSLISMDQETLDNLLKKDADHLGINYGSNHRYKQHQNFGIPELKNETSTWYRIKDLPGRHFDSPELHSRLEDGAKSHEFQEPHSTVEAMEKENYGVNDLTIGEDSPQISRGFGNSGPETGDQIRNRSKQDHDVLLHKVQIPESQSDLLGPSEFIDFRQFTEKDQRESSQVLESPESIRRQHYERVHELNHKVPKYLTKLRNSSSDIETKKEKTLKKTYTLFTPAADEFHIISPWDTPGYLDPEKRTYYALVEFPPEQTNDRVQIIGYPLVLSRSSSIDQASTFPQIAGEFVDIIQNFESNLDTGRTNLLKQIVHHRSDPRLLVPPIIENSEHDVALEDRKQLIDSRSQQAWPQSKHRDRDTPQSSFGVQKPLRISSPRENWYLWNGRTVHHLPEVSHVSRLATKPHGTGLTVSKESLPEYPGIPSSQEYVDAYVDSLIQDALSKVIISEQPLGLEGPHILRNWESPTLFSQDPRTATSERYQKGSLKDILRESQFPEKKALEEIFTDYELNGDEKMSIQSMKSMLQIDENQTMITSTLDSSTDSNIGEIDYQYECEDRGKESFRRMDSEESSMIGDEYNSGSADDEVEKYYSEDGAQQEYLQGSLGYQDEYSEDIQSNSTDYDFRYYNDQVAKVSQVMS